MLQTRGNYRLALLVKTIHDELYEKRISEKIILIWSAKKFSKYFEELNIHPVFERIIKIIPKSVPSVKI